MIAVGARTGFRGAGRLRRCSSRVALSVVVIVVVGCQKVEHPVVVPELRLALTERWSGGGRLILADEHGDRWAVLAAAPGGEPVRDEQPAFSPDGRWLAFVSSRGRALDDSSLWLMPAAVGATPLRVTDGRGVDVDPAWTPDGQALVFARRERDRFALVRVAIAARAGGVVPGPIEPLAPAAGVHQLAPAVAPDGRIAFQEIALGPSPTSRIAVRDPDGSVTYLTDGPADVTPTWAPDGALIYAARTRADGDLDLWRAVEGAPPAPLIALPGTDESGPRWSHDGRWLFATSIARDPVDGVELSSVIYVDAAATPPVARMLRDRAGAIGRQGPAPAPAALDGEVLAGGPVYERALDDARRRRAIELDLARQRTPDAGIVRP